MTVERASSILVAIYTNLLSLGIEPDDAGKILKTISKTNMLLKYKEGLVDLLTDDFRKTFEDLKSKGEPLGLNPSEMIAIAAECGFDSNQIFGY